MIKVDIKIWKRELKNVCFLESEHDFDRYDKLVSIVNGKEDKEVLRALIDSIQPVDDYGLYETLHNAIWKFKPEIFAQVFVERFSSALNRTSNSSNADIGRFLCPLGGWARNKYLPIFKRELESTSSKNRKIIEEWFASNTDWFEGENVLL